MPAAEVGTGRLKSRDARTACASLRQVAADGRAASEGGVPSEGNAAEGMLTERRGAAWMKAHCKPVDGWRPCSVTMPAAPA